VRFWAKIKEDGEAGEGACVQVAELVSRGVVDGVLTSSAVGAMRLTGSLERVHRVEVVPAETFPDVLFANG
jgi:hypothetical protein